MRKIFRALTAFLLAACLLLGVCGNGIAVLAQQQETIHYVSLGDSMSNGYGLPGYDGNTGVADYGESSYANQFAAWLGQVNGASVNHAQLAMSAMRAEDLHWLLEFDFSEKAIAATEMKTWNKEVWREAFPTTGDFWTWDELCDDRRIATAAAYIEAYIHGNAEIKDILENPQNPAYDPEYEIRFEEIRIVAQYYQESVKNADVISLGIGNGNFGVFLFGLMMDAIGAMGGDPEETLYYDYEDALLGCDESLRAILEPMASLLDSQAESLLSDVDFTEEQKTALLNVLKYAIISYAVNYEGTIDAILQLNPDAQIILVGLMNTFSDTGAASSDETTIGDMMSLVYDPLNTYVAALPAYMQASGKSSYANATFYYAEAEMVQCMVETYGSDFYITDSRGNQVCNPNSVIRKRFVADIAGEDGDPGLVWSLLADIEMIEGVTLQPVTFAEVCHYDELNEQQKAAYALADFEKAVSLAMYMAFEDAIITAATEGKPVTIASIMSLGELDVSMFESVLEDFAANIDLDAEEHFMSAVEAVAAHRQTTAEKVIKIYNNASAAGHAEVQVQVDNAMMTLAIPGTMKTAALNSGSLAGLLSLFARCMIGNGLGGHPSAKGHDALLRALVDTYRAGKQDTPFFHVYKVDENSHYLALGDSLVYGTAADGLASRLNTAMGSVGYTNLTAANQTVTQLLAILPEYTDQIEKSDLITLGINPNAVTKFVVSQLKAVMTNKEPAPLDWEGLLGEEYAATVQELLAQVEGEITKSVGTGKVMGLDISKVMSVAINSYVYGYVEQLLNYYYVCSAIHVINPDVQILTIGSYNIMAGISLNMNGEPLDIGAYMQYLADITNLVYLAAAVTTDTCTYVMAPDVKTKAEPATYELVPFIMELFLKGADKYDPAQESYAYIEGRLWDSLEVAAKDEPQQGCGENHFFGAWYVVRQATHREEGVERRECKLCDHYEEQAIPVLSGPGMITSDVYKVGETTISQIAAGTTAAQFLSGIQDAAYVKIFKDGKEISGDTKVGTGMEVRLMAGDETVQTLTAVVTGDVSGDGVITITDMLAVKAHVLHKSKLKGAYLAAGDTSGDSAISITDFIQIKAQILGKGAVVPHGLQDFSRK